MNAVSCLGRSGRLDRDAAEANDAKGIAAGAAAPTKNASRAGAVVCAVIALWFSIGTALAAQAPSSPNSLPPELELRYQTLTESLRCPVCQNESIAVSDSVVSKDLRRIVREKLLAGESDRQIRDYMISRYGLFAVYNPPIGRSTWLLWFGPLILFLIAATVAVFALRKRRKRLSNTKAAEPR